MMWIGHRGTQEDENTIAAVEQAIASGLDAVEIDVRMSKDHVLVCIHDEELDRTTDATGRVDELTLEQIRKVQTRAGSQIPTLKEMIEATRGKCTLIVEMKERGSEVRLAELLEKEEHCIVTSFYHSALRQMRAYSLNLRAAALFVGEVVDPVRLTKDAGAEIAFPGGEFVTPEMVSKMHNAGLEIWAGARTEQAVERLKAAGVDGICVEMPEWRNE